MKKIFIIFSLIALWFILFCQLGVPKLLDSDETRYADMARTMLLNKDFITLYLDDRIFWDKPPLFFWLVCLSYKIFGISEFAVRIPSILSSLFITLLTFFVTKRFASTKVALTSALILATTTEFVIFSRISILDMVLTFNIIFALFCGIMTHFAKEKNKKYFWWLFYLFSALGTLAKGIPSVVVPFGSMFFIGLYNKNLKEYFKPQYFLIGSAIFLLVSLPWHILMYQAHGMEFINEYIIKHHFQRFIGSSEIGRQHGLLYYIPTLFVGFLPWSLPFLFGLKKFIKEKHNKFIVMIAISAIFTFIFFSISKTKLITYILPLYPMLSILCGYMWFRGDYKKEILCAIKIENVIFVTFSILLMFAKFYLPTELYTAIQPVQLPIIIIFILCALFKRRITSFFAYVVLVCFLSGIMLPNLLNVWYSFGQNELMEYANFAKDKNLKLGAYNLWERFSLQYYYDGDVEYFLNGEAYGAGYVKTTKFNGSFNKNIVVIENNSIESLPIEFNYIKKGKRYSLIEGKDE